MFKKFFATPPQYEPEFPPSMVEPCHNLSIEQILRDYTRGIVHPMRNGMFDDGDELDETPPPIYEDISEISDFASSEPMPASRPARTEPAKRSSVSKDGTGAEGSGSGEGSEEGAAPPPTKE